MESERRMFRRIVYCETPERKCVRRLRSPCSTYDLAQWGELIPVPCVMGVPGRQESYLPA
jgi:hypothetical protein